MKIELSIIVPIYNVEKYINRCIDSILAQTFKEFELILVDDESPDNCGKICDEYSKKDSRIRVIHKKNGGLSSARNAGIDAAKGKYIGFIDSDDYIKNDMYESLYKAMLKYDADISMCSFVKVHEDSEYVFGKSAHENVEVWTNIEALQKLNSDNCGEIVVAWNKLYRRQLWNNIRFPYGKIHEDVFIMHEILFKANKIVKINKALYGYLQRKTSIIGSGFSLNNLDYIEALKGRIEFYDKNNLRYVSMNTKVSLCFCAKNYYYLIKISNIKNKEIYLKSIYNLFNKYYFICENYENISFKDRLILKLFRHIPRLFVEIIKLKKNFIK